jgi:hypothetical protein
VLIESLRGNALGRLAAPLVVGALSLSACSCSRACAPAQSQTADEAGAPEGVPPPLKVTTLAKENERLQGLAFDASHVYFSTLFHGSRRVPKAGGPVEVTSTSGSPAPNGTPDPLRSYWNGYGIEPAWTSEPDGDSHGIGPLGVYRKTGGNTQTIARSFPSKIERKVLLVDDTRMYWLEPAASAVLSAPKSGGPVTYVCEAWVPTHVDLALWGDRIFVLSIDGSLSSAPKTGGELTYHGTLSDALGNNRNALWASVQDDLLYIVSDATGYWSVPIEPGKPLPSKPPEPAFEGRVVKVEMPHGGLPLSSHTEDLLFATSIHMADLATTDAELQRAAAELEPVRAEVAAGKVPLTLSLRAGAGAESAVDAPLRRIETWIHQKIGPGVRIERSVKTSPDAGSTWVSASAYVGIGRDAVAPLFAP